MKKLLNIFAMAAVIGSLPLALTSCDSDAENAAEDVGDKIDDAAENVEDAAEDVVD